MSVSDFSLFPEEILFNILDYAIDLEENFNTIRSICKQWKRIAEDQKIVNRLLGSLGRCNFSKESSKILIIKFGENASIINLQYVHSRSNSIDDRFLKDISNSISNVVQLKFPTFCSVSVDSLISLLSKTPKLRSLSFHNTRFDKKSFELMSEYCHDLAKLNLLNCVFDNEALLALSKISTLVSLNIGNNSKIDEETLIKFSAARKNLTCLKICGMAYRLMDQGVISIAKNCSGLEKLSLYGTYNLTDEALVQLAHTCKKLKFIDLSQCNSITDQGVLALFNSCPDLHEYRLFETQVSAQKMQFLDSLGKKVFGCFSRISKKN